METLKLKLKDDYVVAYLFGDHAYVSRMLAPAEIHEIVTTNPVAWAGDHFRVIHAADA